MRFLTSPYSEQHRAVIKSTQLDAVPLNFLALTTLFQFIPRKILTGIGNRSDGDTENQRHGQSVHYCSQSSSLSERRRLVETQRWIVLLVILGRTAEVEGVRVGPGGPTAAAFPICAAG